MAVFWKQSVDIEVFSANKNLIDLGVQVGDKNFFLFPVYMVILMRVKDILCGKESLGLE